MSMTTKPIPATPLTYPVARRHRHSRVVVLFTARGQGVCLERGSGDNAVGKYREDWYPATHESWEQVTVTVEG